VEGLSTRRGVGQSYKSLHKNVDNDDCNPGMMQVVEV
jgi:hypothetical protein